MSTNTSKHVRNYSLPHRNPPKHVAFSAVVRTDAAPRSIAPLNDEEARTLLERSRYWQPDPDPKPGNYAFDAVPTLVKTAWELERSSKRWSRSSKSSAESQRSSRSSQLFENLPEEICDRILDHVQAQHYVSSNVCPDCFSQDLYNLSLVSKIFSQSSMKHLYRDVWLPSNQPSRDVKTMGVKRRNRLRSLLRTLLERPDLASQVRHLRTSDEHRGMYGAEGDLSETLAAIILACPNLESLHGLYAAKFCPTEKLGAITAALTTRKNLKEHIWMIDQRTNLPNHHSLSPSRSRRRSTSFLPVVDPSIDFIQAHSAWKSLSTLIICAADAHLLGPGTLYGVLAKLPSLQNLMLANLPSHICHNGTLQSLPSLHSLRLESLPGITDHGLSQLAHSRVALSLHTLTLMHLDLKSLRTLSVLLASAPHLTRLTLQQDSAPGLPLGAETSIALNTPLLASPTLRFLHWDILVPGSANEALAHSLRTDGLPALRTLRAPCDADGSLQELCRPVARRALTKYSVGCYVAEEDARAYSRHLGHARAAAQLRIRRSRQADGGMRVVVRDERGAAQATLKMGEFVGSLESRIEYCLEPDFEGAEEAVGCVGDVCGGGGGGGTRMRDVCENWERRGRKGHVGRSKERVVGLGQLF